MLVTDGLTDALGDDLESAVPAGAEAEQIAVELTAVAAAARAGDDVTTAVVTVGDNGHGAPSAAAGPAGAVGSAPGTGAATPRAGPAG